MAFGSFSLQNDVGLRSRAPPAKKPALPLAPPKNPPKNAPPPPPSAKPPVARPAFLPKEGPGAKGVTHTEYSIRILY